MTHGFRAILTRAAAALIAAGTLLTLASPAQAYWWHAGWGWGWRGGAYVRLPAPVLVVPPVAVAPPLVAYAPPVVYAPPRPAWVPGHWEGTWWVPGHWR